MSAMTAKNSPAAVIRTIAVLIFSAAIGSLLISCSTGSGSKPPKVATISVSPASPSIVAGATQQFTATAKDSGGNTITGVTFTWASGTTTVATINSSGLATAVSAGTSQITASASGVTSPNDTLTVTNPPAIAVSVSPTNPTVVLNATQQFTATVTNDSANKGVTWALTQGGTSCAPGCGAVSPSSTASGSPTTYTGPATLPASTAVTITATSVADTTKSASTTITLSAMASCGSGSESLLNGQYAFLLKGFDNAGNPALVAGAVTADGTGAITTGVMDANLSAGVQTDVAVSSGSYSVGSDHRGCMTLTTASGMLNYRFSLSGISSGVASSGHMTGFDAAGPFVAGMLRKQDPTAFSTAQVTGNYAFGVSSGQNGAQCNKNNVCAGMFAAVGVLDLSAGTVTGGSVDFNFNGELDGTLSLLNWPASPFSFSNTGSYTISSTTGRGTTSFQLNASGASPLNGVMYVVSSSELLMMSTDSQTDTTGNQIWGGEALLQSGAPFSDTSVSGAYGSYGSAHHPGGGSTASLLLASMDNSNNTFSGTSYKNQDGTFSSVAVSGSYSVDASGRLLLTLTGSSNNPAIELFLVNGNQAFFLNSNPGVTFGFFEAQTGGPFSASSVNATYSFGTANPTDANDAPLSGVVTFDGVSNVTGSIDAAAAGGQTVAQAISETYSVDSTGLIYLPQNCTVAATSTTCDTLIVIISPKKAVAMDASGTEPIIQTAEQ